MGSSSANWIKIIYDREAYLIDLSCISAFVCSANGKITFWLPDNGMPIVINPQSNPEAHQKILMFIQDKTGYSLP